MTNYTIKRDSVHVWGHSGYGTRGTDIVCASLSTLKLVLTHGLLMSGAGCTFSEDPKTADFRAEITEPMPEAAHFVIDLFEREMGELAAAYPEYVKRIKND